jgi:hypothetical protein
VGDKYHKNLSCRSLDPDVATHKKNIGVTKKADKNSGYTACLHCYPDGD